MMEKFLVNGGRPLCGSVRVEGSKNAALPILAATLAVNGKVFLEQVPLLQDVATMIQLLQSMGANIELTGDGLLHADTRGIRLTVAPYELVSRMRASICVLGPLLARYGMARVALPGGCNIGHRPVDIHLRGLAALGADLRIEAGYIVAEAHGLSGADIDLQGPHGSTVTGTCNVMMAAALAQGRTVIRNAAREPEVVDLGNFLCSAGALINGLGTSTIEITGVASLHDVRHRVIPDRIEAATLATAAAITGGNVLIENAPTAQMVAFVSALESTGVSVTVSKTSLRIQAGNGLHPLNVCAEPYPGLPTDAQAQLLALLALADGESRITDNVFPDRFMHAAELVRLGADIRVQGNSAIVRGVPGFSAAPVMASDLRASAALVLGALAADGVSEIRRVYHLDRGYRSFETKLNGLGARIQRVPDSVPDTAVPAPHFLRPASDQVRRAFAQTDQEFDSRR